MFIELSQLLENVPESLVRILEPLLKKSLQQDEDDAANLGAEVLSFLLEKKVAVKDSRRVSITIEQNFKQLKVQQ